MHEIMAVREIFVCGIHWKFQLVKWPIRGQFPYRMTFDCNFSFTLFLFYSFSNVCPSCFFKYKHLNEKRDTGRSFNAHPRS
jgi:hypothetical protein